MIKLIKVAGSSLSPFFYPGDFVLILNTRRVPGTLKLGDFIVFEHPELGRLIKKVTGNDQHRRTLTVAGTNPLSTSTGELGPVPYQAVSGKVILHFKNPRFHGAGS